MAKTLQEILGYVYLCGIVEDVKTGIPKVLPEKFWSTKTETLADQGRYTRYSGTRQTPRRVEYGSASLKRALSPIGSFDVKLAAFAEHVDLTVKDYQSLRSYDNPQVQNMGVQEVNRQGAQFKALWDNGRVAMVHSMLALAQISWDVAGNLLPSNAGANLTIDYGVQSYNLNQITDPSDSSTVIDLSWANVAADIPKHLRKIHDVSLWRTGYPLVHAFYGQNVPSYMSNNTLVRYFLARNAPKNQEFLDDGEIPNGLFGYQWHKVSSAFYDSTTGPAQTPLTGQTISKWFDPDSIVFVPEIDETLYELMEGTYPVPTTFQPVGSLKAGMDSFDIRKGMWAYGLPIQDPPTARIYSGDVVLPIWKVPDCYFRAKVAF